MFLTCKCLNVTIKIRDNCELKQIKIPNYNQSEFLSRQQSLALSSSSSTTTTAATTTTTTTTSPRGSATIEHLDSSKIADDFFQQNLLTLSSKDYDIIKQQPLLVSEINYNNWIINRCVNCLMYTHAVNEKLIKLPKNNCHNTNNDNENDNDDSRSDNNKEKIVKEHELNDSNNIEVLINENLILPANNSAGNCTDNYEKLKNNVNYSKIYKIIIDKKFYNSLNYDHNNIDDNSDDDDDDDDNDYNLVLIKKLSATLQLVINNLQQQYEMGYQSMKEKIDEKIKKFSAEQYEYLDEFKEHGHKEYRTLVKRICSTDLIKYDNNVTTVDGDINSKYRKQYDILRKSPCSTDKNPLSTVKSDEMILSTRLTALSMKEGLLSTDKTFLSAGTETVSPCETEKIQNYGKLFRNNDNSDCLRPKRSADSKTSKNKGDLKKRDKKRGRDEDEEIFPLEGMDDLESDNGEISEDEMDTDDSGQDEGIHIPRGQRSGHPTIAKSLPVSVPYFPFGHRVHDANDDQLSMDPLDPHNIRASIKALAKSVHGDTVFGDLPRPRFSTDI